MSNDRKALLFGLGAILLWSTAATALKLALRYLDVYQLLFYAVVSSSAVLFAIVVWQGKWPVLVDYVRSSPLHFLGMGLINPVLFYLILLRAYDLLPAQQAQTINYTWAITLAVLAVPLMGQALSRRDLLAIVLGYSGVVIIATQGQLLEMQFTNVEGVFFALASTVVWALYWIANARNHRDPIVSLSLNFAMAIPVAFCVCALLSELRPAAWEGLAAAVYVGLFEMGVSFALWSAALRLASGVSRVGNLIFLSPLISMVFIANILGEAIHPATLVGLALIIPGVLIQQSQGPKPEPAQSRG